MSAAVNADSSVGSGWAIKPCYTGKEVDPETLELSNPKCIEDVFEMTDQDNIPGPKAMGAFLVEKLVSMSKEKKPFLQRFAFVLSALAAFFRQSIEPKFHQYFEQAWGTNMANFKGRLFFPTAIYDFRYKKDSLLEFLTMPLQKNVRETIGAACKILPSLSISFIVGLTVPLSSLCEYALGQVFEFALGKIELQFVKAATWLLEKRDQDKVALKRGDPLACFNVEAIVMLFVRPISQTYTQFIGEKCDFFKNLVKNGPLKSSGRKPHTSVFSQKWFSENSNGNEEAMNKFFKECNPAVGEAAEAGAGAVGKKGAEEPKKDAEPKKGDKEAKKDKDPTEDDDAKDPWKDVNAEADKILKQIKVDKTNQFDCGTVLHNFHTSTLPLHLRRNAQLKYIMQSLITEVFNRVEGVFRGGVKRMVSAANVMSGAAMAADRGRCCAVDGTPANEAEECCTASKSSCVSKIDKKTGKETGCVWYHIDSFNPEFKAIMKAGKSHDPNVKKAPYALKCPAEVKRTDTNIARWRANRKAAGITDPGNPPHPNLKTHSGYCIKPVDPWTNLQLEVDGGSVKIKSVAGKHLTRANAMSRKPPALAKAMNRNNMRAAIVHASAHTRNDQGKVVKKEAGATQLYACMWKCQKSTYMGGSNDFCGHEVQTQSGTVRDLCNDFGEAKKAQGLCKKQSPKCNSAWVCASQQGHVNKQKAFIGIKYGDKVKHFQCYDSRNGKHKEQTK